MMKSLTSIAVLALAFSAIAQTTPQTTTAPNQAQNVKIKSKGEDLRSVIATIFEQTGKQFVLETNFHQSLYMSLDGISFEKAIDIISKVADLEFEEKQGIWYIHKKAPTALNPNLKPIPRQIKPVATTTPAKIDKAKTAAKPTARADKHAAGQSFAALSLPATLKPAPKPVTVDLSKRLTVQLKKMDIREVFAEFGLQGKVTIEVDETVPNYKLDAFFYNTSVKFALDKVCKTAGLKYIVTPGKTVRISKA